MKFDCLFVFACLLAALPAAAQDMPPGNPAPFEASSEAPAEAPDEVLDEALDEDWAEPATLADLLWVARPVVVFADTASDPRFAQQMRMLEQQTTDLADRDVVILTDTDPAAAGPLRLELRPRGFGLVLIDRDGSIVQRRPSPTTARELINLIDRLPSRRQETGSRRQ